MTWWSSNCINRARNIKSLLDEFKRLAGLGINCSKSTIFFSNCDAGTKMAVIGILGLREDCLPIKYLGLPLFSSRLSLVDCQPLIDKFRKKLRGWKSLLVSYAGRLYLIRSTLNSFHLFWTSCFLMLKSCLDELEKIIRNFFWGSFGENSKKMKPISWNKICRPMVMGGLGLNSLNSLAASALEREVWFITSQKRKNLFGCILNTLKSESFFDIKPPSHCSCGWRRILSLHSRVLPNIQHLIGNGSSTSFWLDPWLPCGQLINKFGSRAAYDLGRGRDILISSFLWDDGSITPPRISNQLIEIVDLMAVAPSPCPDIDDETIFALSDHGGFSFGSTETPELASSSMVWPNLV